jgi:ABC-type multidrug transport system fused ATPase/permease subunit
MLGTYLRPHGRKVALLGVLLAANIALQLVNPQILRYFLDTATSHQAARALLSAAALFCVIALVQQVVSVLVTYVGEDVGWRATNHLRLDLARHCLRLDMGFHNKRTPGEMIERIDGDITNLANFLSHFVLQVLGNALLMVGVLLLLFRVDWHVGATLGVFVVVAAVLLNRMRGLAVPYWTAARQASADLMGFLEERIAGTQDIRSSGAQAYMMRRFYELVRVAWRTTLKAGLLASAMVNTSWVLFAVGSALAFIVGAFLFQRGAITIGTAYLIFAYTALLTAPLERIMQQVEDLQRAGAAIVRVGELTQLRSAIQDGPGLTLPSGAPAVRFAGVSFAYDGADTVLHDLSFTLLPGQVLGLLGRTGSGKTTLTRLLLRLYDPTRGAVLLGAPDALQDLRCARAGDLAGRVGMVTQTVQLFNATVRDNLTLFDRTIPDARILEVVADVGLGPWYRALAAGLDTVLPSGGGGLSAGEAQLLACTRIFLGDPGLVILDEAASRLDPATEALIERAVDRLLRGRTGIIIAHRLATVQRADTIMILDDGRIREYGPRAELAADPGSQFSHLLHVGMDEVLAGP